MKGYIVDVSVITVNHAVVANKMITIKPMKTNKEKCKEDCNCKIEGKTHSMNDGCGCPAHNYVDKQQFEPQDKEQLKKELIGLVRENVKIIEKYTNHFEPQVDKQQEIRKDWKTAFKKGFVWEQDGNRGLRFFRITNELDWAKHPDKEKFIGNRTLVQPEYLEAFIEEAVSQAIEQERERITGIIDEYVDYKDGKKLISEKNVLLMVVKDKITNN